MWGMSLERFVDWGHIWGVVIYLWSCSWQEELELRTIALCRVSGQLFLFSVRRQISFFLWAYGRPELLTNCYILCCNSKTFTWSEPSSLCFLWLPHAEMFSPGCSLLCWESPRAGHAREECEGLAEWEERLIKKIMMCDILLLQRILLSPNNIICVCPPKSIHAMKMEDAGRRRTAIRDQCLKCQAVRKCREGQGHCNHPCPALLMMLHELTGAERGSRALPRRSSFVPHKEIKKVNWVLRILGRNINHHRRSCYKTTAWPDFNCLVRYWPPHIKKDVVKSKIRWRRYNRNEDYKPKNSLCPRSN